MTELPIVRRARRAAALAVATVAAAFLLVACGDGPGAAEAAALQTAAVPDDAKGPPIDPAKGYLVEEIRDGLYWITDGTYQVMFLVADEGVVLVDAPPNLAGKLLPAIAEVTPLPVTHLIYSHTHRDHIGAAAVVVDAFGGPADGDDEDGDHDGDDGDDDHGVVIVAHEDTAAQLARAPVQDRPLPTVTFDDEMELEVGDQELELRYLGPNHEPGNIFVYAPEQKVLMLVDVIFPGWVPFQDLAVAEDIPGFVRAHDQALAFDFDTFIGGHLTRLGTREDVETQREFVLELRQRAGEALQAVDFFAIAAGLGAAAEDQWLLVSTYLDAVAQHCTDAMLPAWEDRLGGAEAFMFTHCWTMMESLRID